MPGFAFRQRPRSLGAQRARMARWPQMQFIEHGGGIVSWCGPIRGYQRPYVIEIFWDSTARSKPHVVLRDPPLRPRDGGTFEEVPHLMFNSENPARSGLCLFDPDGGEWSSNRLIADTTVVWAAEWLLYYELWHVDGVWRGGGVGYESVAEARAATVHRTAD